MLRHSDGSLPFAAVGLCGQPRPHDELWMRWRNRGNASRMTCQGAMKRKRNRMRDLSVSAQTYARHTTRRRERWQTTREEGGESAVRLRVAESLVGAWRRSQANEAFLPQLLTAALQTTLFIKQRT